MLRLNRRKTVLPLRKIGINISPPCVSSACGVGKIAAEKRYALRAKIFRQGKAGICYITPGSIKLRQGPPEPAGIKRKRMSAAEKKKAKLKIAITGAGLLYPKKAECYAISAP